VDDDIADVVPPALATIEDVRTAESEEEVEEPVLNAIDKNPLRTERIRKLTMKVLTTWMEGCWRCGARVGGTKTLKLLHF
jgi:hypothetical protein